MPTSIPADHARGILLMLVAMLLFTLNDAIGKWLVATYPVGQLLAIRSFAALVVLVPLAWRNGDLKRLFSLARPGLQLVRILLVITEVGCFYWAVKFLPLADVFMFYLASPLFLTALSVIILGQHVGIRRWVALLVGFAGVIFIFPPSDAVLSLPALIALTGSLALALMLTLARTLSASGGLTLITLQTLGVGLAGAATVPFAWVTPDFVDLSLLCLLGLVATTGHFLMNSAVTTAPSAVVAPFQYTSIVWAIILGYLIWGDFPAPQALAGAALIVGSGLFVLYRENITKA
ncbi:MAG: DMT family transporter [Rhodospirillales bacterium]|nr:DMT family transporter [Rhodospirillales bacterium]